MPRTARREEVGALHHVTAKSTSRRLLFNDDSDRQRYLQLLAREIRRRGWRLLTFCLLSNHLHLLVETPRTDLGAGMKRVHETFSRRTNRARGERGHLFGDRFYSGIVRTERHVHGCLRYIARNPVEANICLTPQEWPWSGHCALAGIVEAPAFLDVGAAYEYIGARSGDGPRTYERLVTPSNGAMLSQLAQRDSDDWLVTARDDFAIPIDDLVAFLGVSRSATYRRLANARRTAVSVTSVLD
jgi:REP element-mobilizing transposase RayT